MVFIEETGAAKYYRDSSIQPSYGGTTAIQANDFIGRKLLRDGGAVAKALAQEMRATVQQLDQAAAKGGADADGLALIARRLGLAKDAYAQAARKSVV